MQHYSIYTSPRKQQILGIHIQLIAPEVLCSDGMSTLTTYYLPEDKAERQVF